MPQQATPLIPFRIEHIVSKQHGGGDDPGELALACDRYTHRARHGSPAQHERPTTRGAPRRNRDGRLNSLVVPNAVPGGASEISELGCVSTHVR